MFITTAIQMWYGTHSCTDDDTNILKEKGTKGVFHGEFYYMVLTNAHFQG
jgi:hypothetical protein